MATRHRVVSRDRRHEASPAGLDHFELGAPERADSAAALAPDWSLYCLDLAQGEAVFVQVGEAVDLFAGPFLYSEQFREAQHVMRVPFDDLLALAQALPHQSAQLAWIHSVGRCGSTLVSKAIGTCAGVWSVSEPDVLLDVVELLGTSQDEEHFRKVLCATVAMICKHAPPTASHLVIKPRSQVSELMTEIHRCLPESRQAFMTREPSSWIQSVFSAFMRHYDHDDEESRRGFEEKTGCWLSLVRKEADPEHPMEYGKLWALNYVAAAEQWRTLRELAPESPSLSYEELKSSPQAAIGRLFEALGLSADPKKLAAVLARDSQAGTNMGQGAAGRDEYRMHPVDVEAARGVFQRFNLSETPGAL